MKFYIDLQNLISYKTSPNETLQIVNSSINIWTGQLIQTFDIWEDMHKINVMIDVATNINISNLFVPLW